MASVVVPSQAPVARLSFSKQAWIPIAVHREAPIAVMLASRSSRQCRHDGSLALAGVDASASDNQRLTRAH